MNSIEQKIYDILLDKQKYLKEQKGKDELYFGTEYVKRICDHNGYKPEQVTTAIKSLRRNGYIMGETKDGVYGYMTIVQPMGVEKQTTQQDDWEAYRQYQKEHANDPLPFEVPNDIPAKMTNSDIVAKMADNNTYTYESGYTKFIITLAA